MENKLKYKVVGASIWFGHNLVAEGEVLELSISDKDRLGPRICRERLDRIYEPIQTPKMPPTAKPNVPAPKSKAQGAKKKR